MKKYLIFAWRTGKQKGGWNDLVTWAYGTDTKGDAIASAGEMAADNVQVVEIGKADEEPVVIWESRDDDTATK